jgi:hypothetical protein
MPDAALCYDAKEAGSEDAVPDEQPTLADGV